ncbi:MAG: adenylosuccinate synthase [Candidatus Latescibacterota bacterium]|nr:adenylosuccinate synthase [Candidatus Latescibacterota bacterium]
MTTKVVIGVQWGDEGKAKIVDYLGTEAEIVVRFQGGANAGHTVKIDGETYIFHMVPVGVLHPKAVSVIGNGVVLDLECMFVELDELDERGMEVTPERLRVSSCAHVVLPYHKTLDRVSEESLGAGALGTTARGIGPAYQDKVERSTGIRVLDLLDTEQLRDRLRAGVRAKNDVLTKIYGAEPIEEETIVRGCLALAGRLRPFIEDTSVYLNHAIDEGKRVLFEGAQGTLLDIDHGTYPYVTSSNTTAGGACTGSGVGPTRIQEVIGVAKSYMTRVGNGPFPTEMVADEGDRIRELGQEYGATTGRARRCGWFDATIARKSARVNGLTGLALTRLDILDTVEELKLCTAYRFGSEEVQDFPADSRVLHKCKPVYETLAGWCESTNGVRTFDELPVKAQAYVRRIEAISGVPVVLISVGPERSETIAIG